MPQVIDGKPLSDKEDRQWQHVFDSAKSRGADDKSAAAQATAAMQKSRHSLNIFARCPGCGSGRVGFSLFRANAEADDFVECADCGQSGPSHLFLPRTVRCV